MQITQIKQPTTCPNKFLEQAVKSFEEHKGISIDISQLGYRKLKAISEAYYRHTYTDYDSVCQELVKYEKTTKHRMSRHLQGMSKALLHAALPELRAHIKLAAA